MATSSMATSSENSIQTLNTAEAASLAHYEATIERGRETFVEVGIALLSIRDARLYRATHSTFEAYCRDRWGWSGRRAQQMMAASEAVKQLRAENANNCSHCEPVNEGQGRELSRVPAGKKAEVMAAAEKVAQAESRPVTAADIKRAAAPPPPPPAPKAAAPPPDPEKLESQIVAEMDVVLADIQTAADETFAWDKRAATDLHVQVRKLDRLLVDLIRVLP